MTRFSTSLASREGCFEFAVFEELVFVLIGIVVDTVWRCSLWLLDLTGGSAAI